jgi:hypothetical protein
LITRAGNTTQGTFSPFSQTGWSIYFNGSASQIFSFPPTNAMTFGTGDYTIEFWIYLIGTGDFCVIDNQGSGGNMQISRISGLLYHGSSTNWSYAFTNNVWTHIAFARSGTNLGLFANGVLQQTQTNGSVIGSAINTNYIGIRSDGFYPLNGYPSNLRVVKGQALYTGNFTPATSALTANTVGATGAGAAASITGTVSLLTCQSNRFIDNSTNNFTITSNGNVSVQAFSPFAPTAVYSAAVHGGSAYFDGYADYLRPPPNQPALLLGTEDFTIECWLYFSSGQPQINPVLFSSSGSSSTSGLFLMQFNNQPSGQLGLFSSVNLNNTSTNNYLPFNAWTHVAVSRSNVSTYRYFLNGKAVNNTGTSSASITTNDWQIGYWFLDSGHPLKGYLSDFRIIKGTALYTSDFAPPTAPLTAIANTSLLLNFTNAAITDATAKNVLETVGDARISTVQSKWGGGSMYFDGSGDYLKYLGTNIAGLGSGNFTIEFWINAPLLNDRFILGLRTGMGNNPHITTGGYGGSTIGALRWSASAQITSGTTVITDNTWHHCAIVRSENTISLYVDGTVRGSGTDTAVFEGNGGPILVGVSDLNGSLPLTGYISDLRITKGVARYTANFTPPSGSFRLK